MSSDGGDGLCLCAAVIWWQRTRKPRRSTRTSWRSWSLRWWRWWSGTRRRCGCWNSASLFWRRRRLDRTPTKPRFNLFRFLLTKPSGRLSKTTHKPSFCHHSQPVGLCSSEEHERRRFSGCSRCSFTQQWLSRYKEHHKHETTAQTCSFCHVGDGVYFILFTFSNL